MQQLHMTQINLSVIANYKAKNAEKSNKLLIFFHNIQPNVILEIDNV